MGQPQYLSTDPSAGQPVPPPAAVANVPRGPNGMPAVSSNVSEGSSSLLEMLGPLAHPETITDFARLLTLPVDAVKKAAASALTMAAARAARVPAGNAIASTGRGMERAGTSLEKPLGTAGIVDMVASHNPARAVAIAATPKVVQMAGRGLQRAGTALAAERPPVLTPSVGAAVEASMPAARTAAASAPATNALPNQKLLNEIAIMARRAKVSLTPETEKAAIELVERGGVSPAEAVAKVTASPGASVRATAAEAAPKFRLSATESKEFAKLIRQGKTDAEARAAIEASRAFAERMGLTPPTYAETTFPKGMRGKATQD